MTVTPGTRNTVVFVSLARGVGGSTRSLATVLERLERPVVRLLAAPSDGKYIDYVNKHGLVDERLSLWDSSTERNGRAKRLIAAVRLARWARRNRGRIAAIHANGPEEVNVAAPAALVSGVPLVVWIHAYEVSPWVNRLGPVWRRLLSRHEVTWAAVSATARRVLTDSGMAVAEDVEIVPNPIDPGDVRADHRRHSDRLTVGFIGTAEERKGFQMLADVVEGLSDLPIRWAFYTNEFSKDAKQQEPIWARLRSNPTDRVSFPGKVEDVREAYAECDIVFCPSTKESFCRVAAEAMINGIPVVASDLEPLQDLLGHEDAGLLFPTGDTSRAIAAIRRLALDAELRERLGKGGRERAHAFEPDQVVDRLRAMYGLRGDLDNELETAGGSQPT